MVTDLPCDFVQSKPTAVIKYQFCKYQYRYVEVCVNNASS